MNDRLVFKTYQLWRKERRIENRNHYSSPKDVLTERGYQPVCSAIDKSRIHRDCKVRQFVIARVESELPAGEYEIVYWSSNSLPRSGKLYIYAKKL